MKHNICLLVVLLHIVCNADSITLSQSNLSRGPIASDNSVQYNYQKNNSTHTVVPNPITISTQHKSFPSSLSATSGLRRHHSSAPQYNLNHMSTEQLVWYFSTHGYTEGEVLSHPMLYMNQAYLALVKQLPHYPEYVKMYYETYRTYKGFFKFWEIIHFRYRKEMRKQFARLHWECEQQRLAKEAYERKDHEERTKKQKELTDYCAKFEALKHYELMLNAVPYSHQQARNKAQTHIKTTAVNRITQKHTVAPDIIVFAQEYDIAQHDLTMLNGNTYEQQLHIEFLEQLDEIHTISTYYALQPKNILIDAMGHSVAIGMEANRLQQPDTATIWANFGWKTLEIIHSSGEGLVLWAENTAHMIIDPVSTVGNILYGLGTLVYGGAYAIGCTARTAIRLNVLKELEDYESYAHEIAHINNTILALQTYCTEKLITTSNEDLIKHGTVLAADIILTPKILMFGSKLCARAMPIMRNALVHIKSRMPHIKDVLTYAFEAACTDSPVLQTAEGILIKASEGLDKVGGAAAGIIKASRTTLEVVHAEYMAQLEIELGALRLSFDNKVKGFAEFANKFLKLNYNHILGIESLVWNRKGNLGIDGFHHDFMNAFRKSGAIEFIDQVMYDHGFYKATVLYEGKKIKDAGTFFPAEWPREKVVEKIYEAYHNFIKSGVKINPERDGKYIVNGFIKEGIEIEMLITQKGRVVTAYPILE